MKRIILCLFLTASHFFSNAQTFWIESFGSGLCSGGSLASAYTSTNGAWAVTSTGSNNSSANQWFVSAKERGMGAGVCGAGCGGTNNKTLHMGSTGLFNDLGASYNATGTGNITDKRADSPTINCSGKSGITLSFVYLEFGEGTNDNGTVWYFNGSTWALLVDCPKTLCCGNVTCTGLQQGLWTTYTISMPASADNNASVKIGFRWVNNGNGVGTDPSFAIDDIKLSVAAVLPIELTDFRFEPDVSGGVWLYWKTASERNSDVFIVERSFDGKQFAQVGSVKAAGYSSRTLHYSFLDPENTSKDTYYRIKMVDNDQSFQFAGPVVVPKENSGTGGNAYFVHDQRLEISARYMEENAAEKIFIYNSEGRIVYSGNVSDLTAGGKCIIPLNNLPAGIYLCSISGNSSQKNFRFLFY